MTHKQLVKIEKRISKLPSIYIIVRYAHWCVREYKWTGKFDTKDGVPVPIVWDYDDHNGAFEEYAKRPITHVTTGLIFDWSFYEPRAQKVAEWLEEVERN